MSARIQVRGSRGAYGRSLNALVYECVAKCRLNQFMNECLLFRGDRRIHINLSLKSKGLPCSFRQGGPMYKKLHRYKKRAKFKMINNPSATAGSQQAQEPRKKIEMKVETMKDKEEGMKSRTKTAHKLHPGLWHATLYGGRRPFRALNLVHYIQTKEQLTLFGKHSKSSGRWWYENDIWGALFPRKILRSNQIWYKNDTDTFVRNNMFQRWDMMTFVFECEVNDIAVNVAAHCVCSLGCLCWL